MVSTVHLGQRVTDRMRRSMWGLVLALSVATLPRTSRGQELTVAGRHSRLDVRVAGDRSLRVTLRPVDTPDSMLWTPAIAERKYAEPAISARTIARSIERRAGHFRVQVTANPLVVRVARADGGVVQVLEFNDDGTLAFRLDDAPVLGMGEGGPRPEQGTPWREAPIQFDRRGRLDSMQPRWQADAYGSRNPVAMLVGTSGWALYMPTPWSEVDLRDRTRGVFTAWRPTAPDSLPQTQRNQGQNNGKGRPPARRVVPGLFDIFVFDARDPRALMRDYAVVAGAAVLPPKWALGYMQSHRTLETDTQLIGVIDTFRAKHIPLDAVIYLGTGFTPRGWNTRQPSFEFNPEVFTRDPKVVIADIHARHVKVVVHMVPWDRDRLPTLHGSIPPKPGESLDSSHIARYWRQHVPLIESGVDAFWPDEGDWFDLFERIERHRMYHEGPLSTRPNVRPWSLHRNGHAGIAQWGGWVWSGDTESSWKTLEGQIAVGLNHSLSIGPYWGSDIGGFYPNNELTGELYARWFQFGAFTPSFRSHGRAWWTRLPWGWGLSELGPRETSNNNAPTANDERRVPLLSELNNPAIEPIARTYAELRYRLLPYTYTLAWEARDSGMPFMRAMWLHYPTDPQARALGSQYLWGHDLLIAPVFEKGATTRDTYLPAGEWYDWWTNERLTGGRVVSRAVDLATMPIYVRAGGIIPLDPVRQHTGEVVSEPTTLRVYPGADGSFTLYDDDGMSQAYLNGRATWTRLTWNDRSRRLSIEEGSPRGAAIARAPRTFVVELVPGRETRRVTFSGAPVRVQF